MDQFSIDIRLFDGEYLYNNEDLLLLSNQL